MNAESRWIRGPVAAVLMLVAAGQAQSQITAATDGGSTNDALDYSSGARVTKSDSLHISGVPRFFANDMIGAISTSPDAWEPGNTIFQDTSRATDNFWVMTPSPVVLNGYRLRLGGEAPNRSATSFVLQASSNGISYTTLDTVALSPHGQIAISNSLSMAPAQFFKVALTRAVQATGIRVIELDGFGASSINLAQAAVDANAFNALSNSGADEPPGLGVNFTSSSQYGGTDPEENAFGNNDGGINPGAFLFANGTTADNGNGVMGDGGETVHWIAWNTTESVTLAGYQAGLYVSDDPRTVQLVRFSVDGVVVDLFDFGDFKTDTPIGRYFNAPVSGTQFKIEFTGQTTSGPRIREINAIRSTDQTTIAVSVAAPSGITSNSATFNAVLLTPATNADVYAHWGPTNGTNNPAAWTNTAYVGSWTNVASTNIAFWTGGLSSGSLYYYTFSASNDATHIWASPSASFTTYTGTNAFLTALVPSVGTLSPTFASNTFSYTASVPNTTHSMTVTPTAAEPNATITVNGATVNSGTPSSAISLGVGDNVITNVVVSQDLSATNTYLLTVVRGELILMKFAIVGSLRRVAQNSLVTYTVTFSDDMDAGTVSAADFGNAGASTIGIGTITETAPGVFSVPVTPTSVGTLRLQIPAGATLTDIAGNPLATTTAILDDVTLAVYQPDTTSPELHTALTELKDHINGTITLSAAQIDAHMLTIDSQKSRFGSSVSTIVAAMDLVETYDSVIGPLWVAPQSGFTRASVTNDIHWTIFNVMQNIMDKTYTAANIANYDYLLNGFMFGSSANFPGACAPPADPDLTHTATINGNYPDTWGWPVFNEEQPARKPTGAYLAPGSIATVTVPASLVGRGYQIRVGCHSWDFGGKPTVKRLDRVTLIYPITAIETKVANPLGGGIYIEVPQYVTDVGIVNVQIKNAVRSPYFSAKSFHQTTPTQWLAERANPVPWADFQSEKYMMQVPTSWVHAMPDPTQMMKDWDAAADACNDLMGFPHDRGKETMYDQVDLLLRASVYAPGYPAVNNSYSPTANYGGYSTSYLVRGPRYAPGLHFHEHGHGFKFPKFPGETESAVNLPHVAVWHQKFGYSLDEAFRQSAGSGNTYQTLDTTAIAWMMCDHFLNGSEMLDVEKQYHLKGHAKFVDIARMFGWGKLNDYGYSFTSDYENDVPYGTTVDKLLLRLSKSVGVDIRPLFHFWGVPPKNNTTLGAAITAANLPASAAIRDTLVHYKSLIPADNAAFRTFASSWWGRQPLSTGYSEEKNHASRWATYDAAAAAATANRAQQIIDLYFFPPTSADYTAWTAKYPAADLTDPNADLDGDGLSNDQERIWGLNPASAASRNPVTFSSDLATGSFSYTRRTRTLTGLTYTVWTSPDLVAWTRDGGAVQTPGAAVNEVETVFVTLSPALLSAPKLFVQVRAAP